MIFLPLLFWCRYETLGRSLVNLLAFGVIGSGIIKDLLCLPRPVSPPIQRITMSGSVALEYGFPSTHSTNAVSVALYAVYVLSNDTTNLSSGTKIAGTCFLYIYAISIAFGRLYCGMHGFTDVVVGSVLGALLAFCELQFGEMQYDWLVSGSFMHPLIVALVLLVIVRTHPEPADNCPCFDDSVAFSGVVIGINFAQWHILQPNSIIYLITGIPPERLNPSILGISLMSFKSFIRVPLGVAIIVAYRSVTKHFMFRILPPLFRVMESLDLDIPRRYFLKASQYRIVPRLNRDDNVLPNPSDVGQMIGDVRRRRGRAISIGPQSDADAYEMLAYREEARRRERSNSGSSKRETGASTGAVRFDHIAKETTNGHVQAKNSENDDEAKERQALFSTLPRARVRYDVEVVTKLIVYFGIGWLAVEGCPLIFELLNLGPDGIANS
jgi:dihydrosphingosine 1-phosphate phosphatase